MSADPGARQSGEPIPDFSLPDIVELEIRRVPFRARKPRNFTSALARYDAAIEFTVTTDGPFPVRALGPALYVGQTAVVESEQVEGERYRFLAFEPDALEEGAPIALGWSARSSDRRETRFRFELPAA